ncbi:hypothetical protein IFR04_008187 [Cadophora malorum]|uniref:Uncharacterized protein n=1 Tax=Cadophora malorum TaxID=108018 RepID=A0A8H7TFR5_9HELO|nr:hypothetical protein IFR04_008187 [Cadophora malorum]
MAADYYHPATSSRPMSMYNPDPRPRTLDRYDHSRPMAIRFSRSPYVVEPLLPVVTSPEHSSPNQYRYARTKDNYYERERPTPRYEAYHISAVFKEEPSAMNEEPRVRRISKRAITHDGSESATVSSHTLAEAAACGLARSTSSAKPHPRDRDSSRSREHRSPCVMPPVELSGDPDRHPSHENENEVTCSSMDNQDEWPWICCECGVGNGILSVDESPGWYCNCCSDCSIDADFLTRKMD